MIFSFARTALAILFLPILVAAAVIPARRTKLMWGGTPLISHRHWSRAMREAGFDSQTIVEGVFAIHKADEFDLKFADFAPHWLEPRIRTAVGGLLALVHVLRRARVLHISYDGFALSRSALWGLEAPLLKVAGIKIVMLPYGGDAYVYSRVMDPSLQHGLLASYPQLAVKERRIAQRLDYWNGQADVVLAGWMIDGNARWDVTGHCLFCIDTKQWTARKAYSARNGVDGPVRIMHTPNHRGFKGTEFLLEAIRQLEDEGLEVELHLMEKVPNEEVRRRMSDADILAEQFIFTGYAFSGIEGMASGLPVLANLDHEAYTRLFRRYAFLNECPILSSPPERLKENLRILVTNPALREELGRAGRAYVEKYHSYAAAQFLFGSIYDRILDGKDVDLINLFHPLKSDYVRRNPVRHPLIENRLPPDSPFLQC